MSGRRPAALGTAGWGAPRRECCNEYYVLAARALAALRSDACAEDLWRLGRL